MSCDPRSAAISACVDIFRDLYHVAVNRQEIEADEAWRGTVDEMEANERDMPRPKYRSPQEAMDLAVELVNRMDRGLLQ
jgi:hypothetical protein